MPTNADGDEHGGVRRRHRQQQQADQRESHADRQRVRLRARLSVMQPTTGCSSDAVAVLANVMRPICPKSSA